VASLAATFGRGAMTNGWTDVANADVVLIMGGNPAENHPVGFRFAMEARRNRKAKLVVWIRASIALPPSRTCTFRSAPARTSPF
jgi:anaerobic selenocysteine-containing dehydrogenase